MTIFLFDVDGVIVNPLAYRIAINKSLELLGEKVGLSNIGELLPTSDEISRMEACGVHDVWDITNIVFGSILAEIALSLARRDRLISFDNAETAGKLARIKDSSPEVSKPSYMNVFDALAASSEHVHPPDAALQIFKQQMERALPEDVCSGWLDLERGFLSGTRSAYESYGTRLFQNVLLGPEEFEATYGLPSEYHGVALLRTEDVVLINESSVQMLRGLNGRPHFRIAIYTARPSHPPEGISEHRGYCPEAEVALELAGLSGIPLVGMGMMDWLAARHGESPESLTKPHTTQAFAALIAAASQSYDANVLESAYDLGVRNKNPQDTILDLLRDRIVTIYLFEDTISGIRPVMRVAEQLNEHGYAMSVRALGIAKDESKRKALQPLCVELFEVVNDAIEFALNLEHIETF